MAITGYRAYGGSNADFVASIVDVAGTDVVAPVAGATLTMYDAITGGAQITDLKDADGNAITEVTVGASSTLPRFYVVDTESDVYADGGDGNRTQLIPTDLVSNPVGGGDGAVDSVNEQTGAVVLTASDVGALADDYAPAIDDISDAGATGKEVLAAASADIAREALGVGAVTPAVVYVYASAGVWPSTRPDATTVVWVDEAGTAGVPSAGTAHVDLVARKAS